MAEKHSIRFGISDALPFARNAGIVIFRNLSWDQATKVIDLVSQVRAIISIVQPNLSKRIICEIKK